MTDQTSSGRRPPMPDYDALSVGDIAHRARSLSTADVEGLLRYERAHAARTPVLKVLSARIAQLGEDDSGPSARPGPAGEPPPPQPRGSSQQRDRPGDGRRP
ncbi:hypothetical protein N566_15665 [Streptomycetaceae bacterium MP113-05]|nr:hypothetical protein N566_15665 [Streptomycetaceae bacterium MP113-05]